MDVRYQIDFYLDELIKENQIDQLTIEQLDNMKYSERCTLILMHEGSLLKKATDQQLPMLRMKGSIQSYELYDSTKYEKVRIMLDILEQERIEDNEKRNR